MKVSTSVIIDHKEQEQEQKTDNSVEKELLNLKLLHENGRLIGQFDNISDEAYHHHECPADSRSTIMLARKSIALYAAKKKGLLPFTTSPSKEFGKMAHKFLLEKEIFFDSYARDFDKEKPLGDTRKLAKNGGCKEEYQEWKAERDDYYETVSDKTIVSDEEFYKLERIVENISSLDSIMNLLKSEDILFETSCFFTCPISGQLHKFKPDIMIKSKRVMIDFKTAVDASDIGFSKAMSNHYYDVQGAHYLRGAEVLFGGDWTMGFIAAEKTEPFMVNPVSLSQADREIGQEILDETIMKIMGMPPMDQVKNSYSLKFKESSLPAWAYTKGYR